MPGIYSLLRTEQKRRRAPTRKEKDRNMKVAVMTVVLDFTSEWETGKRPQHAYILHWADFRKKGARRAPVAGRPQN
jgi:hypothetical protein